MVHRDGTAVHWGRGVLHSILAVATYIPVVGGGGGGRELIKSMTAAFYKRNLSCHCTVGGGSIRCGYSKVFKIGCSVKKASHRPVSASAYVCLYDHGHCLQTQEKLLTGYFRRVGMEVWVGRETLALYTLLYFLFKIMSIRCFYNTMTIIKTKWKKEQITGSHPNNATLNPRVPRAGGIMTWGRRCPGVVGRARSHCLQRCALIRKGQTRVGSGRKSLCARMTQW